jgi:hypothetical protein
MIAGARILVLACVAAAPLTAGLAPAASLSAQLPSARLIGRVTAPDGRPAAGVELVLVGLTVQTLSIADGTYELRDIPPGPHNLEVRLIGHRTVLMQLDFASGSAVTRDVQLEVEPIPLDPVNARAANLLTPAMQGFHDRRVRGGGYFYTRDDIKKMQARQFTDVLRRVPGATLQTVAGPFGTSYVLQLARTAGLSNRVCPVLYYMNGTPFPVGNDNGINNYIVPDDVDGVEVYTGTSRVPAQFNSGPNNSRCGVVVIWTFSGRGGRPAP